MFLDLDRSNYIAVYGRVRDRVGYLLNFINSDSAYRFRFFSIPSFDSNVIKKWYQTFILYLFFKPFNCCWIPWTKINRLHKNWTHLRAVCVQTRAAWFWIKCLFFSQWKLWFSWFWRKNIRQLKITCEWNDSMTHSRFTCFITGWISIFEKISCMIQRQIHVNSPFSP